MIYEMLTKRRPFSRAALRQLEAHVYFQLKYLPRRRKLVRLADALDRSAAA